MEGLPCLSVHQQQRAALSQSAQVGVSWADLNSRLLRATGSRSWRGRVLGPARITDSEEPLPAQLWGYVASSLPCSAPPLGPGGAAVGKQAQRAAPHCRGRRPPPPATQLSVPSNWACGRLSLGQSQEEMWVGGSQRSQGLRGQGSGSESTEAALLWPGSAAWACRQNLLPQARKGTLAQGGEYAPRMTTQYHGFFCPGQCPEARTQGPPVGSSGQPGERQCLGPPTSAVTFPHSPRGLVTPSTSPLGPGLGRGGHRPH